jgi:hypothetical protein
MAGTKAEEEEERKGTERERERRVVQCTNSSHFATFGLLLLSNGAFSLASVPFFENRLFRGKKNNYYYYYYYYSFWNRFVGNCCFWVAIRRREEFRMDRP